MNKTKIVFATNNINKANEVQQMLPDNIEIVTLSDIGCTEDIPETELTLEGNAILKANYVTKYYKLPCFADDTGLEIEALNGEPGVFSARYSGEEKSSKKNIDKVLKNLQNVNNRKAQFRTVISLNINNQQYLFEGICKGEITHVKSGSYGFGYDPIFKPNGFDVTFADMTIEDKNTVSHRGRAIRQLVSFLNIL